MLTKNAMLQITKGIIEDNGLRMFDSGFKVNPDAETRKITWKRTDKLFLEFEINGLDEDTPVDVFTNFIEVVVARVLGRDTQYSEYTKEWIEETRRA